MYLDIDLGLTVIPWKNHLIQTTLPQSSLSSSKDLMDLTVMSRMTVEVLSTCMADINGINAHLLVHMHNLMHCFL